MIQDIKRLVLFFCIATLLCGVLYPAIIWGIGQTAFPYQANGSLLYNDQQQLIGSALLAPNKTQATEFTPRPTALMPTTQTALAANPSTIIHSASMADADLTPAMANSQIDRIARARGVPRICVADTVLLNLKKPLWLLGGVSRVNIWTLNTELARHCPVR